MNDFLNEEYLDKESITSYKRSDMILTLFFAVLDLIVIIVSSINLKSKKRKISELKQKVIKIFIFDIIIRLLYNVQYNSPNLYKENLLSLMNTSQFYLIISFLDLILFNPKLSKLQQSNKKDKQFKLCILFFFITFSYEKLPFPQITKIFNIKINKIILFIQSLVILYCIYKLHDNLKIKITDIVSNIKIETQDKKQINLIKFYLFILGSPLSCLILFTIYYCLKIVILFILNAVFALYASILLNIVKNSAKYFTFFVCEVIIYVLNKISIEKEKELKKNNKTFLDEVEIIKD